ncbi:hypothetical protein PIROE2DRAFT_9712 [Piromyces sp. E2]|nr:hypothetical protein PIROE2DRAFT_9712 [Piromyces sp. E2]|eukprot:OUM63702.1 hypothetical protein PIROE2DRAFT_9712 [Piromyces sp. E2]
MDIIIIITNFSIDCKCPTTEVSVVGHSLISIKAEMLDPVIGRNAEIRNVICILSRKTKIFKTELRYKLRNKMKQKII